jgi:exopolysaccharide biosynthesis predicted pyruvyltransferase EpsI
MGKRGEIYISGIVRQNTNAPSDRAQHRYPSDASNIDRRMAYVQTQRLHRHLLHNLDNLMLSD